MTKNEEAQRPGPDPKILLKRFWKVAAPYWFSDDKVQARWQLAAVFALTLGTTGISVGFNFLGRDFYNALASNSWSFFLLTIDSTQMLIPLINLVTFIIAFSSPHWYGEQTRTKNSSLSSSFTT